MTLLRRCLAGIQGDTIPWNPNAEVVTLRLGVTHFERFCSLLPFGVARRMGGIVPIERVAPREIASIGAHAHGGCAADLLSGVVRATLQLRIIGGVAPLAISGLPRSSWFRHLDRLAGVAAIGSRFDFRGGRRKVTCSRILKRRACVSVSAGAGRVREKESRSYWAAFISA